MKLQKLKRRMIALVLSVAIIGTGNGISTFGTTISADSQTNIETTEVNKQSENKLVETSQIGLQPEVVKEIKKERTENSNTYLMSDGSKKLELFATDIRYKEDGKWVDYDTTLVEIKETDVESLSEINVSGTSYSYVNAQGNIKHYFADKVDVDTPIIMTKDDYEIRFAPVNKEKVVDTDETESMVESPEIIGGMLESEEPDSETSATSIITNEATKTVSDKIEIETITDDSLLVEDEISFTEINADNTSEIVYSNGNESIEYRYHSLTNGVKESIVLNEKPDTNMFEFTMDISGMEAVVSAETNEIHLKDTESKEVVAVIAPPNIMSGTDIPDYDHVEYELVELSVGNYILKVVVDSEYLESATYPLVIDPTYVWQTESMIEFRPTMSVGGAAGSVINGENGVTIMNSASNQARMYVRIKELNEQLAGKYVYQSYFITYTKSKVGDVTVGASRVLGDWNASTLTWNTQPDISTVMYDEENSFTVPGCNYFMLTDWAKEIASGEITDEYGFALSCTSAQASNSVTLYSPYEENQSGIFFVYYQDVEDVQANYDVTYEVNTETTEEDNFLVTWESYSDAVCEYDIYVRKDEEEGFIYAGKTVECEYTIAESKMGELTDIRVIAVESEDATNLFSATNHLSNIVTIEKYTENVTDEEGNETIETYYEQTIMDTDGDELEDGYEIWDFKTLWNTVVQSESEEGEVSEGENTESGTTGNEDNTETEVTYDLDTDDDGFPDSYEVFTLGTDPAVANVAGADSDGDGLSDIDEYENGHKNQNENQNRAGTDPYLVDSDFDGVNDMDDFGDTNPRKTDNPRVIGTDRLAAYNAQIHIGLYDEEYVETEGDVTTTYVRNVYSNKIKSIYIDYGNVILNKKIKYFYDEKKNKTAIIEENTQNGENTVCITYTYDNDGNITFICDQSTKYTMDYRNGEITEIKVGNQSLVAYENISREVVDTEALGESEKLYITENITIYGKNAQGEEDEESQKVRIVTTDYEVDNDTSTAKTIEVFYENSSQASYVTELNNSGEIIKFTDKTREQDIEYNYSYLNNSTKVERSDGFTKEIIEDDNDEVTKNTKKYSFKDLTGENTTYTSVVENSFTDENAILSKITLYNNDSIYITTAEDEKERVEKIHSNLYNVDVITSSINEVSSTKDILNLKYYGEEKNINYIYDNTGNIIEITDDDTTIYKYEYDVHGRLIKELNYTTMMGWKYGYSNTGNMEAKHKVAIDENGNLEIVDSIRYLYGNTEWLDQLTRYDGQVITYDRIGNPLDYINGMKFIWSKGKQLSEITFGNDTEETEDDISVIYRYNQDGLRTYKETEDTATIYEWDENKLIREIVTYKSTGKNYDIWYLYDGNDSVIGFEYNQLNEMDRSLTKTRIYYKKNLQGDVIGLLDARGAEIVQYEYDAWGNIVKEFCYEGYEIPFILNHITYRGYYHDDETDFYYLQSRYYDPIISRFINADDSMMIGSDDKSIYKDNLYIYCNANPINCIDYTGRKSSKKKIKFSYNRNYALEYMERYYDVKEEKHGFIFTWTTYSGYNRRYPYFERGDCTNFASQCLHESGIPMTWYWYCYNTKYGHEFTHSWSVVLEQRKYLKNTIVKKTSVINSNVTKNNVKNYIKNNNPKVGDIIYFHSREKNKFSHTAIISKVGKDFIGYSAHTDSRMNMPIIEPLNGGYYDYVQIFHIKNKGKYYV